MINILIVDDHAIVREGLKHILADAPDMIVAGEAGSGREAMDEIRAKRWDVIVLDLCLPDRSGLEVLRSIKNQPSCPPVLVLTIQAEELYAARLLQMGACGYLSKESAPAELATALRRVAQGGKYIGLSLAERLMFETQVSPDQPRHESLSDREFQVLSSLVAGKTVSEIAVELSISVKTASTHRARILEKLRLKNNAQLVQYAIWHRLVPWSPDITSP